METIGSRFKRLILPSINFDIIPPEQRDAAEQTFVCLRELENVIRTAHAALALFNHCRTDELVGRVDPLMLSEWCYIAARDFTANVYHFADARHAVNRALNESGALLALMLKEILATNTHFEIAFPSFHQMHDVGAHRAEMQSHASKVAQHALKIEFIVKPLAASPATLIGETLVDRTYSGIWRGAACTVEVSDASVDALIAVKNKFFAAFEIAAAKSNSPNT